MTSPQSSLSLGKWGKAPWQASLEQSPGMVCVYVLPAASSRQIANRPELQSQPSSCCHHWWSLYTDGEVNKRERWWVFYIWPSYYFCRIRRKKAWDFKREEIDPDFVSNILLLSFRPYWMCVSCLESGQILAESMWTQELWPYSPAQKKGLLVLGTEEPPGGSDKSQLTSDPWSRDGPETFEFNI